MAKITAAQAVNRLSEIKRLTMKLIFTIVAFTFMPWLPIGFVCWFSKEYFDIHDYKKHLGGDGIPTHFHVYTCWNCGKRFSI